MYLTKTINVILNLLCLTEIDFKCISIFKKTLALFKNNYYFVLLQHFDKEQYMK